MSNTQKSFPDERITGENESLDNGAPAVADNDVAVLFKSDGTKLLRRNEEVTLNAQEEIPETGKWTITLIFASVICCFGSALPAGYNIGVVNNAAEVMKDFCNQSVKERYNIDISQEGLDFLWSTIVSIFLIGGVAGSLTSSHIANIFGRKGALISGNICGIIGAILFFFTPTLNSIELFLIGRIFVGLSGGLATSIVSTYMTEVSPIKLRGAVGVLCQLGITCGVLLGQIASLEFLLGNKNHWSCMLAAYVPLCIFALVLTFFLPESPKYLFVIKEDRENALLALSHFRNADRLLLHNEIADLETELAAKSTNSSWSIVRLFREPNLRLPLLLVSLLQLGQQLSGINAVFYYSNLIFKKAGFDTQTSQYATIGTGIINVGMALISVKMMSHFGRRTLLLISLYLSILCLVVSCFSITMINFAFMKWICIFGVQAFVLCYGIGLGPIPYFIGSELFDAGPRSAAMSIGSVCNWGGNFIVGMTFTLMQQTIEHYSFLVFAAFTLFLALFSGKYLPETRGKTTIEIAASVSDGLKSRPNARHFP